MQRRNLKLIVFLVVLCFFIAGFLVNILSDSPLYNQNLNIVPQWQTTNGIDSDGFMTFMNLVSTLLDPPICAGYLALIWLFTTRRLEIMVFLLWFIFMSWVLSVMKSAIGQPRPFWQPGSGMLMKSWICYTQFGCPSGHSMMGLVLLQFLLRFLARGNEIIKKYIGVGYLVVLIVQCLVMFSRVILGMHTFNEVLMGAMIGIFIIVAYNIYLQSFFIALVATFIGSQQGFSYFIQQPTSKRRNLLLFFTILFTIIVCAIDLIVTFIPTFDNGPYWQVISLTKGCQNVKQYKSFQYKCLEDMAIMMAAVGMSVGLIYSNEPGIFVKKLSYSRCSLKNVGRILGMLLMALVPVGIFLNPLWQDIDVGNAWLAVIIWVCQTLGFFSALFILVYLAPLLLKKCNLQTYDEIVYTLPPPERSNSTAQKGEIEMNSSGDQ